MQGLLIKYFSGISKILSPCCTSIYSPAHMQCVHYMHLTRPNQAENQGSALVSDSEALFWKLFYDLCVLSWQEVINHFTALINSLS